MVFPFGNPGWKPRKTNWWLSKEKELSNWNKIIGLTYFLVKKKNLFFHIGFGSKSQEKEPLTLVIKVIFQAFNLQKILWICQDDLRFFSHSKAKDSKQWSMNQNYSKKWILAQCGFSKEKKVEREF